MGEDDSQIKSWSELNPLLRAPIIYFCKVAYLLREFGSGISPNLGEAIASNNFDMAKSYREIAWIKINGLCYKIIDYFVL